MDAHEDSERTLLAALKMAAEPMSDRARTDVRQRVMGAVRSQARLGFFLTQSRRIAAAATAATVLLGSGVAYAANESLPGSALYPIKRAAESAIVAVLPTGSLERTVLIGLAERRAEEAGAIARRAGASQADITGILEQLRTSIRNAGGETGLQEQELLRIRSRIGEVPDWASAAIEKAISADNGTLGPNQDGTGSPSGNGSSGSGPLQEPNGGSGGTSSSGDASGSAGSTGSGGTNGGTQPGPQNGLQRGAEN